MTAGCSRPDLGTRTGDYVLGALPEGECSELEDHLAGCITCADRVRALDLAMERLPERLGERPAALRARWARLGLIAVATTAAAGAAGLLLGPWLRSGDGPVLPSPSGGPPRSYRTRLQLVAPLGTIEVPPAELRWTASAGIAPCRAHIVLPDLSPVWTSPPTADRQVAIPSSLPLEIDAAYLWRVSCGEGDDEVGTAYAEFRFHRR